jgi:ABC-type Fe3+/spermidine/putrescine transport system ATPase subunit
MDGVSVRYGDMLAVDAVTLSIEPGDVLALVGPSGCGKTSLLKAIAGLEPVASGRITLDGARLDTLPPHRRNVGMVFQSYALFPHKRVRENVAFGLAMRGERGDVAARVRQALDFLQIGHLADAWPDQLSGGQQQRVALARTLVVEPRLLLLDEPLSALDRQLRDTMRAEIRSLVKTVGITTLIVTHDQDEAMSMADRIAVMRGGRIEQEGPPRELYRRPASAFVADFLGRVNRFAGKAVGVEDGRLTARLAGGATVTATRTGSQTFLPGDDVALLVRTEALHLDRDGSEGVGASVADRTFLGGRVELALRVDDGPVVRLELPDRGALPENGERVRIRFEPDGAFAFPAETAP